MNNIKKFSNLNSMWDGYAGCELFPEIPGKENDGYREPVYAYGNGFIIICCYEGCCAEICDSGDEIGGPKGTCFKTQAEAIEYLEMINPTKVEHLKILGFE